MKYFYKKILFYLIILNLSLNVNASDLTNKYYYAKKNYSTAILSNNKNKEIKYLKQLIKYGSQLKRDTSIYKYELKKLNVVYSVQKPKKQFIKKTIKKVKKTNKYYSISNITTQKNTIIIRFKHNISKSYIKFTEYKKNKYYYDTFDLKGNFKDASPIKLKINGIKDIWISQVKNKTLRLRLKSSYNLKTIYIINKKNLIIKILNLKKQSTKNFKTKIIPVKHKQYLFKSKTIVIDPGHGGKDGGASGPHKRLEKNSVLNISKYLYKELKQQGFKVYLTRDSDKFISLKKRTKFANKKHADIFVSIHANSISKSKARKTKGIETYFLSPARSDRSKRIAANENSSDMDGLSYSSKNIVLTLLNRGKITASQKIAIDVQSYMLHDLKKYYGNSIIDKGVREGPFWVLVGAQMPSILIEVGYISHPNESYKLYNKTYQKRIASGIAHGILAYFSKNK